ncbi:hypothetical protein BLNAU_20065 [Blattamonas nauphoetae]|uniref:Uncharacterized protein n=1 Tax=Blattamonas nauphoetae TaxID=2049346 RepID=A0ABQ9X084_9EUKA|nr:hypothetical protein BLNAU_20065 [Blattamonas nauphoetae]
MCLCSDSTPRLLNLTFTLAHPANDRICRIRSFTFVFVHSESLQTLVQNSYNMHDGVYTPGKQFFRVLLLFFQRQPFSSFIPMDDVAATFTAYTSKINHRVTTVKCEQFARRVMTEEIETDQRMGQMESSELWARA